jgi:hypothetical protein
MAVGRDDKAIEILERAAKFNKLDFSTIAQRIELISIHKVHRESNAHITRIYVVKYQNRCSQKSLIIQIH